MPCALTQNYTLDCKDSLGGITEVYFARRRNFGKAMVERIGQESDGARRGDGAARAKLAA